MEAKVNNYGKREWNAKDGSVLVLDCNTVTLNYRNRMGVLEKHGHHDRNIAVEMTHMHRRILNLESGIDDMLDALKHGDAENIKKAQKRLRSTRNDLLTWFEE